MLLSPLQILTFVTIFGNVYCTYDVSNPTTVYVVEGGEAVLQCGFDSSFLDWYVYNGDSVDIIASGADVIDISKYLPFKKPSTELYYVLHVLNVRLSDIKKYKCQGILNGGMQRFYLQLILIVMPTSLSIENATLSSILAGTEGQDLTVSCKSVGGTPAPNVVLIIDEQSVASQTQIVQHTLNTINRSYDQKTVTCQASHPVYEQNSLNDSAVIVLYLKPLQPSITVNKVSIEETKPLNVTCTTTGSRPRAILEWRIGQKDVTSNATEWFNNDKDSDTYTVTSDLIYRVGKSEHGQMLICKAVNVVAPRDIQSSITLNVKYAPIISVTDVTFEKDKGIRTVTCVPVGNPGTYTYYRWQHKSKHGVLIRELDGETNGVLTLPSIPVEDIYQDSGEYVCTAGNGIVGRDGKVQQTGSGYVIINAQPIFTNDNKLTQYGEFGKNVYINVYVYSIPIYIAKQWYRGNTSVSTSTRYVVSESLAIVNDRFHGTDVKLDGHSVMLTINNLKESDFNVSYRLQLSYGASQTVQYTVLLESAIIQETSSSGLYAVIGGMAGGVTVLIIIVIILGTLHLRKMKGLSGGKRNEISNRSDNIEEMSSPNRTTNDMYEEIREGTSGMRSEDLQQRGEHVSPTTYEMLGMQDIPNTYGDLSSEQEQRQCESTTEQYETLGEQNKPNVYEQIKNKQEPEDRECTNLKV